MAEPRYGEERKQMGSIVGDRPKISVIMGVYDGVVTIGLFDFLLDEQSIERY
jgi:hypothetical protein